MISSRDINDLLPPVAAMAVAFKSAAAQQGIDILITSTFRDFESQTAIYNQGRTTPGRTVTNAKAGQSFHNYRCALDFAPLVNGKINWNDTALFTKCGKIAETVGFEWAGNWKTFKELAHVQYSAGLTIAQLQAGASIEDAMKNGKK